MGLFSVAAQIIVFYLRFGRWNTDSTFMDYLLFFLAGALGGWILTYFLNRQTAGAQRRWALMGFLVGTPAALFMMIGGGLISLLGVLILRKSPGHYSHGSDPRWGGWWFENKFLRATRRVAPTAIHLGYVATSLPGENRSFRG